MSPSPESILKAQPQVCVLDTKESCVSLASILKGKGVAIVAVDRVDIPEADRVLLPCFGGTKNIDHSGGPEYLLIRSDITQLRPAPPVSLGNTITVSFGGEDPFQLTEKTIHALAELDPQPAVDVVIGPGFARHRQQWPSAELNQRGFRIIETGDPLETILPGSGLLITALGVSVAEAMVMGVPVAVVANYESDEEQAQYLAQSGAALTLGYHEHLADSKLSQALADIWHDQAKRQSMAQAGLQYVDGQGAARSAAIVAQLLELANPGEEGPC